MYKNFKITEEEKKQILESHIKYGYKTVIKEQEESNDCSVEDVKNKLSGMNLENDSIHIYGEPIKFETKRVTNDYSGYFETVDVLVVQLGFSSKDNNVEGNVTIKVPNEKYKEKNYVNILDYGNLFITFNETHTCEFKDVEEIKTILDMIENYSRYDRYEVLHEVVNVSYEYSRDDRDDDMDDTYDDGMSDRDRMYQDRRDYAKGRKDWDDEQRREYGAGA